MNTTTPAPGVAFSAPTPGVKTSARGWPADKDAEPVPLPKLPPAIVMHPQLGELFDRLQMQTYAMGYAVDCTKAARGVALPAEVRERLTGGHIARPDGVNTSADTERLDWLERNARHAHFQHSYMRDGAMVYVVGDGATPRGHGPTLRAAIDYARGVTTCLGCMSESECRDRGRCDYGDKLTAGVPPTPGTRGAECAIVCQEYPKAPCELGRCKRTLGVRACPTCKGRRVVDDGEITHSGGAEFLNGPIKCVADCPTCRGTGSAGVDASSQTQGEK